MRTEYRTLLLFFFIWPFFIHSNDWQLDIYADRQDDEIDAQLVSLPFPILISQISYDADITISTDELDYLTGFCANEVITLEQLKQAIIRYKKKNRFQRIQLKLVAANDGYSLRIIFTSFWCLKKLKLYGLREKEQYRQYYQLEAGDPFDFQKHIDCIKRIEKEMHDDGYLQANITHYLTYDDTLKLVTAHITLDPDIRFRIYDVDIQIDSQTIPVEDQNQLCKKIDRLFIRNLIGSYYQRERISKLIATIKEYLRSKGFSDTVIEITEFMDPDVAVRLRFTLHIRKQRQITIRGNRYFSKKQLIATVADHMGDYVPDRFIKEDLLQKYYKQGFWYADIGIQSEDKRLNISIHEGSRVSIKNIQIDGADYNASNVLVRKFFSSFLRAKYFDAASIKDGLMHMLTWYSKKGFWDVKVLKQSFIPTLDSNEFILEITLDEGTQRLLGDVCSEQFPEIIERMPFAHAHPHKILEFDHNFIAAQRQWLVQQFNKQGYLSAHVWHDLRQTNSGTIMFWHADVGQQTTFGKTIITGISQFPFHKIQKILDYKENRPWNKDKISNSFERLQQLGIFETVYVRADTADSNPHPVILKLVDDDPFELRLRFGFQQVSKNLTFRNGTTYKVGGAFIFKNPTNSGDVIRFDADVTRFYRNLCAQYNRPWNFGLPIWFTAKVYNNTYLQPVVQGSAKTLYEAFQQGFLMGGSTHSTHVDFGLNVGLETMETTKLSKALALAINFAPTLVDKKALSVFFEPNFLIDFLNDKINPSKGSLSMISGKINIPSDKQAVAFFKILAEQSIFCSIRSLIAGMRIRVGHVFGQQFRHIMPPDRFYLGGENSLRGYGPDQAPPFGIFVDDNGKRILVPQGGKSMFNVMFELRFPVYWRFLQGAIFQDFGILIGDSFKEVKQEFGLASTGFGLRYLAPIGPIRFDIGFKWKRRDPEESRFAWFLTLGQSF